MRQGWVNAGQEDTPGATTAHEPVTIGEIVVPADVARGVKRRDSENYWYKSTMKIVQERRKTWWDDQDSRYRNDQARTKMAMLQRDIETAALLRTVTRLRRQEHSCELCGHRFNYNDDGTLKPTHTWCRRNKTRCDSANGWDFCLDNQELEHKQKQRRAQATLHTNGQKLLIEGEEENGG